MRNGKVGWAPPTRSRIYEILHHPAYGGFYVFGRHVLVNGGPPNRVRHVDWHNCLVVPNHHPAYISPAEFRRIEERLRSNRIAYGQPTGAGPALCQGLIRCGRCGRKMYTQYTPCVRRVAIEYVCCDGRVQHGEPLCWNVNGNRLDEVVAAELLQTLAPPGVEAVAEAAAEANAGYEAARRQREAELARVRYEADLAKLRYENVDPKNRRVAAALEEDRERALAKVQEVERQQAEAPLAPPVEITPDTLHAIQNLGADLPGLWVAPSTTNLDRKHLVRLLIREALVVATSEVDFEVEIAWVGRATTRHRIVRPRAGSVLAHQLAAQGLDGNQIAAELNRRGVTTMAGRGSYKPAAIRKILVGAARRAGTAGPPWRVYREELRAPLTELIQAGFSDGMIAAEFTQRGLRSCFFRTPWKGYMIRGLRHVLGIPSGYKARYYPRRRTSQERRDARVERGESAS